MASWDDLPGEVRNQIYRFLLVNDKHVDTEARRLGKAVTTDLNPVILRVCKKVYKEASSVLYRENKFRFDYPFPDCHKCEEPYHLRGDDCPKVNLAMIKKVEICWNPKGFQHLCEDAEEIMQVMEYVDTLGCSPDTLRLVFSFHNARAWDLCPPSHIVSKSARLKRAIEALDVKNEIVVKIESDREDDWFDFEKFVFDIGSTKHWAVNVRRQSVTVQSKMGGTGRVQEGGTSNHLVTAIDDVGLADDMEAAPEGNVPDTDDDQIPMLADNESDSSYFQGMDYGFVLHRWTWTIAPTTTVAADITPED